MTFYVNGVKGYYLLLILPKAMQRFKGDGVPHASKGSKNNISIQKKKKKKKSILVLSQNLLLLNSFLFNHQWYGEN